MSVRPMPAPSLNEGVYMPKKKQKQSQTSAAVTGTAPPQPAQEVSRTTGAALNTGNSVYEEKFVHAYEQPVPKPKEYNAAQTLKTNYGYNTSKQSSSYSEKVSSYNPLSLNRNKTATAGAYGSTKQKTVTYDAVPVPKTQYGSVKPQQTKSYSYTEVKPKSVCRQCRENIMGAKLL